LPAFNTNTKPLKFHALDQLLRILMRAVGHRTIINIASVSAQHGIPASWPMGHSRVAALR
jgi:NAD(P)-dependent dehydrogenase (short-subunit alcohol dehydrogenase family)